MSLHTAAKYIAQHGRDGDTHLLHVTESELKGIAALGDRVGRPLTTNPHTGLPEASGLGDWLPSILGVGASIMMPELNPLMIGLITGAGSTVMSGNLGKGIMSGLLAGGGASLMGDLAKTGGATLAQEAAKATPVPEMSAAGNMGGAYDVANYGNPESLNTWQGPGSAGGWSMHDAPGSYSSRLESGAISPDTNPNYDVAPAQNYQMPPAPTPQMQQTMGTDPSYWEKIKSGAGAITKDGSSAMDFVNKNKYGLGAAGLGGLGLAAAQSQENLQNSFLKAQKDRQDQLAAQKAQYASQVQGPWVTPETVPQFNPFDSSRFVGGRPAGYAEGGQVGFRPPTPGDQYVYQPDGLTANGFTPSSSPYGGVDYMGMLNSLPTANTVQNFDPTPFTLPTPPMNNHAAGLGAMRANLPWLLSNSMMGGDSGSADPGDGGASVGGPDGAGGTAADGGTGGSGDAYALGGGIKTALPGYSKSTAHRRSVTAAIRKMYASKNEAIADMRNPDSPLRDMGITKPDDPMLNAAFAVVHAAGGKYLQGPGDGLSDDIPARINGVQEARLADGEVVLPADFVSDVGNGSSNAGAKKIMAHVAHVRKKKHGTPKQPGPLKGPIMPGMR